VSEQQNENDLFAGKLVPTDAGQVAELFDGAIEASADLEDLAAHEAHMRAQMQAEQEQMRKQMFYRHLSMRPVPSYYTYETAFLLAMHQYELVFNGAPELKRLGENNFYAALTHGQIRYTGEGGLANLSFNERRQVTNLEGWHCMIPKHVPLHAPAVIDRLPNVDDGRQGIDGTGLRYERPQYFSPNRITKRLNTGSILAKPEGEVFAEGELAEFPDAQEQPISEAGVSMIEGALDAK
jgi:hypothetical protein